MGENRESSEAKHERKKRELLLWCLKEPTASATELRSKIGVSESTMARLVRELDTENALQRRWVVNLDKLGWKHKYRIDVKINPRELRDNNTDIIKAGGRWKTNNPQEMLAHHIMDQCSPRADQLLPPPVIVENVSILLGDPADLSVVVRVNDPELLYPFITTDLREIEGVENTSTCTEAWAAARVREEVKASESGAAGNPPLED